MAFKNMLLYFINVEYRNNLYIRFKALETYYDHIRKIQMAIKWLYLDIDLLLVFQIVMKSRL